MAQTSHTGGWSAPGEPPFQESEVEMQLHGTATGSRPEPRSRSGAGGHLDEVWWQGHWNGPVDWSS